MLLCAFKPNSCDAVTNDYEALLAAAAAGGAGKVLDLTSLAEELDVTLFAFERGPAGSPTPAAVLSSFRRARTVAITLSTGVSLTVLSSAAKHGGTGPMGYCATWTSPGGEMAKRTYIGSGRGEARLQDRKHPTQSVRDEGVDVTVHTSFEPLRDLGLDIIHAALGPDPSHSGVRLLSYAYEGAMMVEVAKLGADSGIKLANDSLCLFGE